MAKRNEDGRKGDGDGELFRRAMADAAPLRKRRRARPAEPPAPSGKQSAGKQSSATSVAGGLRTPSVRPFHEPPAAAAPPQPTETSTDAGRIAGLDRRTADRLRRGRLPIEARLDLHGSFQDDAHRALNRFVVDAAASGKRVVLVITGKGRVSEGGGVLRRNVPQWLKLAPCAPHVLAVVPAQPQHGGAGAFYVMLRRKRD